MTEETRKFSKTDVIYFREIHVVFPAEAIQCNTNFYAIIYNCNQLKFLYIFFEFLFELERDKIK